MNSPLKGSFILPIVLIGIYLLFTSIEGAWVYFIFGLMTSIYQLLYDVIKKNNLFINYLTRDEDKYCWQFSNKGYFNFKSNIPKILSQFKLN